MKTSFSYISLYNFWQEILRLWEMNTEGKCKRLLFLNRHFMRKCAYFIKNKCCAKIIAKICSKNIGITSVCLAIVGIIGGTFDKNFSKDSRIVILLIGAFCTIVYEVLLYVLQGVFFQISVEVIPFLKILALETIYNIFIIIIIYPIMKNVGYEIESEIKGDKILTRYF